MTRALVKLDTTVVSGLAVGIDSVAHRSAIKASGRTFAVIGTGFDRAYPAKNRPLQAHLATHIRCRQPVRARVAGGAGELPPAKPDDGALERCVGYRRGCGEERHDKPGLGGTSRRPPCASPRDRGGEPRLSHGRTRCCATVQKCSDSVISTPSFVRFLG